MLVKSVIAERENIGAVKMTRILRDGSLSVVKGYDFYRVMPREKVSEYDSVKEAISSNIGCADSPVLIHENCKDIIKSSVELGLEPLLVKDQHSIVKKLEELYTQHRKPSAVIFDYDNPEINPHNYLREIYINQNLGIFRNVNVIVTNFAESSNMMVDTINVLGVNCSPRKNGDSKRLIVEELSRYWSGPYYNNITVDLDGISECVACGGHQKNCRPECVFDDQMVTLKPLVMKSDVLLLSSPVYMDLPTARAVAFLSRLTGETKYNRRAFIGKFASVLSPSWCSGTKNVISSLNNALEMMGFTIQGRSSREYVKLWQDNKTRGGVPNDYFYPE
ncbi:Iron-sulfur flavoprotein [Candidatus Tiddalikarchaeum anstoanum]|nr:Iron-sulfur flavoprotein [Candidatus Tiddalikarchaeum anstoanum]